MTSERRRGDSRRELARSRVPRPRDRALEPPKTGRAECDDPGRATRRNRAAVALRAPLVRPAPLLQPSVAQVLRRTSQSRGRTGIRGSRRPFSGSATRGDLLEQFGQPPVLEDAAAGLLVRAVVHLVLGEEDRLDPGAAARAGLALAPVDPQRLRRLVGQLGPRSSPRSGRSRRRGRAARSRRRDDLLVARARSPS